MSKQVRIRERQSVDPTVKSRKDDNEQQHKGIYRTHADWRVFEEVSLAGNVILL
jgi:ABC-type branched-subunit amino acid transport system ATPase component